jgi:hypothetical protein
MKRSQGPVHCIYGHAGWFTEGETENDRIRRERDRLKQDAARLQESINYQRERAEAAERRTVALKGVATRLKNRAAKGVCPCCNRSFENLRRHMHTKHPGVAMLDVEKLSA